MVLLCIIQTGYVATAQCSGGGDRTAIVLGHPDDALAFMHDSTLELLNNGGCLDIIAMTSYYDNGVVISGREEGGACTVRVLYERV